MGQIRYDGISLERRDSERQETWFLQLILVIHSYAAPDLQPLHWQLYWECTHLENIYERLQVSSRTSAVTRAFPDRVA
jgi:hypothetical protein